MTERFEKNVGKIDYLLGNALPVIKHHDVDAQTM